MSDEAAPFFSPQIDDDLTDGREAGAATVDSPDEAVAIGHAVDRLAERFPKVSRARIAHLVHQRHLGYTGAPVRDFIPVLIEHDVKRELAAEVEPLA